MGMVYAYETPLGRKLWRLLPKANAIAISKDMHARSKTLL